MIANLPRKDIFSLWYLSVLTAAALYYGFNTIPSPIEQRDRGFDHKRVVHLGGIKYAVDEHFRQTAQLPENLSETKASQFKRYQPINSEDPETMRPYEYKKITDKSFSLCATFMTDSTKENKNDYDRANYNYITYRDEFAHPKGHHCFTFQAPQSYIYFKPTPTPLPVKIPSNTPVVQPNAL